MNPIRGDNDFKPRVVIFLGAGAASPLGIPTSTEFFSDGCFQDFEEKDTFLKIADELETPPEKVDIERICEKVERAKIAIESDDEMINRKEAESRVRLRKEIYKIIYQKCSDFNQKKCSYHYSGIFTNLDPRFTSHLAIFTTNYDHTLEFFFRRQTSNEFLGMIRSGFGYKVRIWDGFVKAPQGGLVWRKWGYGPLEEDKEKFWDIPFYKMHGSIGWFKIGEEVIEIRTDITGKLKDEYLPLLVFPGFKGLPDHEIYQFARLKLREELEKADCALVIGFNFRDDYIAEIFDQALIRNENLKITAVNPSEWPQDSKIHRFKNLHTKIEKYDWYFGNTPGKPYTQFFGIDSRGKRIKPYLHRTSS